MTVVPESFIILLLTHLKTGLSVSLKVEKEDEGIIYIFVRIPRGNEVICNGGRGDR